MNALVKTPSRIATLPLLIAACTGCWKPPDAVDPRPGAGLIWIIPGIEGSEWSVAQAYRALRDGGVQSDIRVYNWWNPNPLANLTEYNQNRKRAGEIAQQITEYRRRNPLDDISLIGYSGGGGLAVFTAEALPESARLRHVVLIQAAISPDYDLTPTLTRIDGKLVNLYSPLDYLVLGVGTSVFGTMDRKNVPAAGNVGFVAERAAPDPALRSKLEQRPWTLDAVLTGHFGTHLGKAEYEWNRRFVVPYFAPNGADIGPPAYEVHAAETSQSF
ncbi:MAG: hypothetical protein HRF50_00155 [Phycisphaerae bacterium]|jgi:pimeloyl-ACP methyl ester carboxylesterase